MRNTRPPALAREYFATLRARQMTLALLPALVAGALAAGAAFSVEVSREPKRLMVFDRTGRLFAPLEDAVQHRNRWETFDKKSGLPNAPMYMLEAGAVERLDQPERRLLADRILRGQLDGYAEIAPGVLGDASEAALRPSARLHAAASATDLAEWFQSALSAVVTFDRLRAAGLDEATVRKAQLPIKIDVQTIAAASADARRPDPTAAFLLAAALVFFALATLWPPHRLEKVDALSAGGLLGHVGASLTVAAAYILAAFWTLSRVGHGNLVAPGLVAWFVALQAAGVTACATVFVALGPRVRAVVPVLLGAGAVVWFPLVEAPLGGICTGLSFFPLWSPMLMPARLAIAAVPVWQPAAALVVTVAAAIAGFVVARRVRGSHLGAA